jgi:hypothetical protein
MPWLVRGGRGFARNRALGKVALPWQAETLHILWEKVLVLLPRLSRLTSHFGHPMRETDKENIWHGPEDAAEFPRSC